MKLYIIYIRTMENSPEVRIVGATNDMKKADDLYEQASREANEWMADTDEDSGDWASAHQRTVDMAGELKPGDTIYAVVQTVWHEVVETTITPFFFEINAKSHVKFLRQQRLMDYPELTPFDGEPADEAMHLEDPCGMVDVYFSIETVTLV